MAAVVAVPRELTGDGLNRASVPRRKQGDVEHWCSESEAPRISRPEALRPMSTELLSTKLSCTSS